jgi:hypothetical protein
MRYHRAKLLLYDRQYTSSDLINHKPPFLCQALNQVYISSHFTMRINTEGLEEAELGKHTDAREEDCLEMLLDIPTAHCGTRHVFT